MLFIFPRPLLAVRPKYRAQNLPPGIFNRTVRVVYAISVARTDWIYAQSGQKYRQYRIILSADTASEVRQLLSQKRR